MNHSSTKIHLIAGMNECSHNRPFSKEPILNFIFRHKNTSFVYILAWRAVCSLKNRKKLGKWRIKEVADLKTSKIIADKQYLKVMSLKNRKKNAGKT